MRGILGLFALVLLAGCVSAQVVRLGAVQSYPPVPVDDVQVFLTEGDVPGPFVKVALIKLKGDADWTDESGMVFKAKKEAAKIGANGLLLGETEEPGTGAKIAAAVFGTSTTRRGEVVAIRFDPQR